MYSSSVYKHGPVWLQNVMLSARAVARRILREGSAFRRELAEVENTQSLSREELARLQLERLQKVVRHAALHVPYYRESFLTCGFSPDQLASLEDLQRIPILTKRNAFDAGERMLAENVKGPRFTNSTSGTTGMSMTVVRDLHSINRENAFIWRQCSWAGGTLGDRRVWIRGDQIVPSRVNEPPFWRYNWADNMMMMSSYHLSEKNADLYLEALEKYDPVFAMTYPSPMLLLARYMTSIGREYRGKKLKGIITSSETLMGEHRRLIEGAFGCRVFDQYGSAERVTFIGTCEHGNYHINTDYGLTELLPLEDGTCEVVGTSFDNYLMPWIRYRLGDSVVPADPKYVCPCGRAFPVVDKIVGRVEDYVLAPDGRHIFMVSNILDAIPNILEGQVRQESPEDVSFLVVKMPGTQLDEQLLMRRAHDQLGDSFRINIELVTHIPRTANGKLRVVVRTI